MVMRSPRYAALLLCMFVIEANVVCAQTYPVKPIKFVTGAAGGGSGRRI